MSLFPRAPGLVAVVALAACAPAEPPVVAPPRPTRAAPKGVEGAPPTGQLPAGVKPSHYALTLDVAPEREGFSGEVDVDVDLDAPRSTIWMHAKRLVATAAFVRTGGRDVPATMTEVHPSGVVALRTSEPVGPGHAVVHVAFTGAFGKTLQGLYRVKTSAGAAAFTQFESIYARQAFPSFDEPGWKTPFDVTLVVPKGDVAVANTREIERTSTPAGDRVRFATTAPLPTYLLAAAVGPLDVVEVTPIAPNAVREKPLALRGVAAKGRGKDMAYALSRTGEILAALERYFGTPYPFDKLDIIAVPDKGGAMENPGAVTFREWLVLFDPKTASVEQKRAFFYVMAHELAHQWTGDLVTMKWWDDTWLNEAFATWMGNKIAAEVAPEPGGGAPELDRVQGAMVADALVSARRIREPIHDTNDISNAFDSITYQKGGAVLGMFERYLGPDVFRSGVRAYLEAHRFGNATADDLLSALDEAAARAGKRAVGAPFRSFLDQPGVPLIEGKLVCGGGAPHLHVTQSRYLPLGSTGSAAQTWQVPVCVKYAEAALVKSACALVKDREGDVPLPMSGCPRWVHPNEDAAGYYRWTLPAAETKALAAAPPGSLTPRERVSFVLSVRSGFSRGTIGVADAFAATTPLAGDPSPSVAFAARDFYMAIEGWFPRDAPELAKMRARAAATYLPVYKALGWGPKPGAREDADTKTRRGTVIRFLADFARDPGVRREAAARGRAYVGFGKDGALHPEAVETNLATTALAIAVEEGNAAFFEAVHAVLAKTTDEAVRVRVLTALSFARVPALAERARGLALDPTLRGNEWSTTLEAQLARPATRDDAWRYVEAHFDAILARPARGPHVVTWGASFCERARIEPVRRLFAPKIPKIEGGPRAFDAALEEIALCAARRDRHEAEARALFGGKNAR